MLGILEVRVHAESATRVLTLPHGTVTVAVHPASDIQRAFALPKYPNTAFGAWLGSDVATSVPVPNASRVLWLWGDTLLGNLYQDAHAQWRRNVTAMPRNSLAAQVVLPGGHIASPLYWSIRYNVSEAEHSGVFAPRNQSRWYWPTSGAALDGHTLVLLAYDTYSTKPHVRYHAHVEEEAARPLRRKRDLDFNFERSVLLVVRAELAASDPLSWRAHTLAMPHTGPLLQWCTALVVETSHVYLFGATPNATVLARLPLAALLATPPQLSSLEYWTTAQKWAPELRDTGELAPVFGPGVRISETSVTWSETLKCYYALNIRYMQYHVEIAFATRLTGPWTPWQPLYTIPAPWNNASLGIFDYAPKSHPEYAHNTAELIISFTSNSLELQPLFDDPRIYVPQFLRVTLSP